jgi:hypothetical protein
MCEEAWIKMCVQLANGPGVTNDALCRVQSSTTVDQRVDQDGRWVKVLVHAEPDTCARAHARTRESDPVKQVCGQVEKTSRSSSQLSLCTRVRARTMRVQIHRVCCLCTRPVARIRHKHTRA